MCGGKRDSTSGAGNIGIRCYDVTRHLVRGWEVRSMNRFISSSFVYAKKEKKDA